VSTQKVYSIFLFLFLLLIPFNVYGEQPTERVIIMFQHEIDYELLNEQDVIIHHTFDDLHAVSATISVAGKDALLDSPSVKFIEDDPEVKTTSQEGSWGYKSLNIEKTKQSGLTGKNIKIGILDTGIRMDHPDLQIENGVSFVQGASTYNDDNGHGTHVAGIIASKDNDIGVVGVAPDAQIYAVKVLNQYGEGNQSDVVAGINWAIENKLDIINLSITSSSGSYLLQEALQRAYDQGIMIVAASGNIDRPIYGEMNVLYPARYPSVIAVGSVNYDEIGRLIRSDFSYYGKDLDFVAPGQDIYSTFVNVGGNDYGFSSGTSMAAPFVTGMAALYKEAYPTVHSSVILEQMEASALDLGSPGRDAEYGYGLIQSPPGTIFTDVADTSWYAKEVKELYNKQIVNGYDKGKFNPDAPITRAEAVTMLGRAKALSNEGTETPFYDVPAGHFAAGYINSAVHEGIIFGYPDNSFQLNTNILRADVAVILQRAFDIPAVNESLFPDVLPEYYYFDAVNSLAAKKIANGYPDGSFKPGLPITRAEFSILLYNTLKLYE